MQQVFDTYCYERDIGFNTASGNALLQLEALNLEGEEYVEGFNTASGNALLQLVISNNTVFAE